MIQTPYDLVVRSGKTPALQPRMKQRSKMGRKVGRRAKKGNTNSTVRQSLSNLTYCGIISSGFLNQEGSLPWMVGLRFGVKNCWPMLECLLRIGPPFRLGLKHLLSRLWRG